MTIFEKDDDAFVSKFSDEFCRVLESDVNEKWIDAHNTMAGVRTALRKLYDMAPAESLGELTIARLRRHIAAAIAYLEPLLDIDDGDDNNPIESFNNVIEDIERGELEL
jgi:hypothetical protein